MPILTLDELVTAVRAEIGDSTNMAMGVDALPGIRQMLKRIQETYYEDFDWPHLKIFREEEIYAGQNIYTFNSDVDSRRIFGAWAKNNDSWIPLEFGITPEHYNSSNPENGDSDTLPLRWDYAEENQFEIWPVPNEDTRIRFRVMKQLAPLAAGSNKCELDSNLLILTAAAELLARAKSEDAQLKLSIATSHYNRLKGRYFKSRMFVNGKSDWDTSGRSGRSRIIIGSTTTPTSPTIPAPTSAYAISTEGGSILFAENGNILITEG